MHYNRSLLHNVEVLLSDMVKTSRCSNKLLFMTLNFYSWFFFFIILTKFPKFSKILNFFQNFNFFPKFQNFSKISIFFQNFKFFPKFQTFSKISNFFQNFKFFPKFQNISKISNFFQNFDQISETPMFIEMTWQEVLVLEFKGS